jgi:hypothetical protein
MVSLPISINTRNLAMPQSISDIFPSTASNVNYLVNWSEKNKIIYTETPKVGCTVLKRMLHYAECSYDISKMPVDVHNRKTSPLKQPNDNECEFIDAIFSDEYFKFSFVRNPFTRALSTYLDKIIGRPGVITPIQEKLGINPFVYIPSFHEFIDMVYEQSPLDMDVHWAPQTFLLGNQNIQYDYLGRFEFFQKSVEILASKSVLEIPPKTFSIGKEHATNANRLVSKYYSSPIISKVREIYYDDFKYLGYGWSV